jgi:hypothetical protein
LTAEIFGVAYLVLKANVITKKSVKLWTEKILCYLTISASGVDSSYDEHIFIEPNKNNQWQIIRRSKSGHSISQYRQPIHDLPRVYYLEWRKNKKDKVLIFKNKFKKIIEEF